MEVVLFLVVFIICLVGFTLDGNSFWTSLLASCMFAIAALFTAIVFISVVFSKRRLK